MQKLLLCFLFLSSSLFSQTKKGFCKITEVTTDASKLARVTFKFLSPDGKPVLSRLTFKINDSLVDPKIDKKGTYTMVVKPGEYKFSFFMRFWYDINSKPAVLKPKTNTSMLVKFEAQDLSTGVK
jgi:hypothetical protein